MNGLNDTNKHHKVFNTTMFGIKNKISNKIREVSFGNPELSDFLDGLMNKKRISSEWYTCINLAQYPLTLIKFVLCQFSRFSLKFCVLGFFNKNVSFLYFIYYKWIKNEVTKEKCEYFL